MKVIVDTSAWSLVLRRSVDSPEKREAGFELAELIKEGRVVLLGTILQEILSGIKKEDDFFELSGYLSAFDIELDRREYYEIAARIFNACRKKGIQGSHGDFYICAAAQMNRYQIFTYDKDFYRYSPVAKLDLYKPRYSISLH